MKYLTFSFDDGNIDDIRLVKLLNKYGLKATFNLNSGLLTYENTWQFSEKKTVHHINYLDYQNLYDGHEVACHTYSHPDLTKCDKDTIKNEIGLDKKLLSFMYGYEIEGMAYPFGRYNDDTVSVLKNNGIKYARTVKATHTFDIPDQPLILNPTCHFKNDNIFELAKKFIADDHAKLFYIWGHSYELVSEEDWTKFEDFCKYVSTIENVEFCTNITAINKLCFENK